MILPKSEYEFFNKLTEQEFYAVAKTDFDRYCNFIENESKKNKGNRHARFDEERRKKFEKKFCCVENCIECAHKNCEHANREGVPND